MKMSILEAKLPVAGRVLHSHARPGSVVVAAPHSSPADIDREPGR